MIKQTITEVLTEVQTNYPWPLTPRQGKVLSRIASCRTPIMGGQLSRCDNCDVLNMMYYSCRDRHCPQCQSLAKAKWLEDRKSELLPIDYYHVVFTLPHELNPIARVNPKVIYNLLNKAAWKTVKTLGADEKRLNGKMGMMSFLHTWGQQVNHHIHLHCIVPGGAISNSQKKWHPAKSSYLFPVRAMSRMFRGCYVSALRRAYQNGELEFQGKSSDLAEEKVFGQLLDELMKKEWVVYCKKPLPSGKPVLNYLSQYTHKIAISNHRIISTDQHEITFTWKDYSANNKVKKSTIKKTEFRRRYLLHVLPSGFMRVRHYGFLGSRYKRRNLDLIRRLLNAAPVIKTQKVALGFVEMMQKLTGTDVQSCAICKTGKMVLIGEMPRLWKSPPDK